MSCSYADGLSPYENKGKLGLKEIFDCEEEVRRKVKILVGWIERARHIVVHTGAGISTAAGIPDFRGPKGVWTLEAKGEKPNVDVSFDDAQPTKTHMSLLKLVNLGLVKYVVSQNIDGLHLKSGLAREHVAELHGNMYIERCTTCNKQFVMKSATSSVGQKCLGRKCQNTNRRPCRGKTCDTILDWEAGLPQLDLDMAYYHSCASDLNICLGTTLQINPSGNLPLNGKKNFTGKLVICNLQPTKHDKKADLIINTYADEMMTLLLGMLDLKVDEYSREVDPTKQDKILEWTISEKLLKSTKDIYQQALKERKKTSSNKRTLTEKENKNHLDVSKKPKSEDGLELIELHKIKNENGSVFNMNAEGAKSSVITEKHVSEIYHEPINSQLLENPKSEDEIDSGFSEALDEC